MRRETWIVVAIAAVLVLFLLIRNTEPVTSEGMIQDARQACLDFGHPPEDCPEAP